MQNLRSLEWAETEWDGDMKSENMIVMAVQVMESVQQID